MNAQAAGGRDGLILRAFRDRCIGSAQCALRAPELFGQDDDGVVVLLNPEPGGQALGAAIQAVSGCPVQALSLEAGQSGSGVKVSRTREPTPDGSLKGSPR